MDTSIAKTSTWRYGYFTDEVAARAGTDEMLQDLILAIVNIAADCDMYAMGKFCPDRSDHASSYYYFRELIDGLGIPPRAIIDVIDECCPGDSGENLTERDEAEPVEVEVVTGSSVA